MLLLKMQESSRHHWEKMCQVASQVDSLLAQRSGAWYKRSCDSESCAACSGRLTRCLYGSHEPGASELQGEVARIAGRLVQMEGVQDRTAVNMEEQQRLMRQLTTAMQKVGAWRCAACSMYARVPALWRGKYVVLVSVRCFFTPLNRCASATPTAVPGHGVGARRRVQPPG